MNNCFIDSNRSIGYRDMEFKRIYGGSKIANHHSILLGGYYRNNQQGGLASNITFLTETERIVFFTIFLIILGIAIFGNIAAIYAMRLRKCRFLQKTCVTSLAISDMIMAIAYGINNMETFSHPQINWTLGPFMCSFIPFLQMLGITASTWAIVIIALDRYKNVVQSVSYRWNPQTNSCIIGFVFIWTVCIGTSLPIYYMFEIKLSFIAFIDTNPIYYKPMYFCISLVKEKLMLYYILMAANIFTPLFIIFIWLYVNIAKLIWTHRKPPPTTKYHHETSTNETSITYLKSSESQNQVNKPQTPKVNSIHVERKIRTFKIIICLMLVFFICRIPFWTFNILKLLFTQLNEPKHWVMTYIFNALALLNCALNPFLYTFVNQTLQFISKLNRGIANFTCDICCCCFNSSDFDHFERENPFLFNNGNYGSKLGGCKIPKVKLKDGPIGSKVNKEIQKY